MMTRNVLFAALLLSMACSGPTVVDTGGGGGVAGRYVLTSIAGRTMPTWAINSPAVRMDILSGEFTLRPDGSATTVVESRATSSGVVTTTTSSGSGTYSIDGTTIRMDMSGSAGGQPWQRVSVGTINGSVVLYEESGQGTYRYEKQ